MTDHLSHYRMFERLGVGGMGTVYRGEDARSGRIVAVKVLHPHLAADPAYVRRFRREAQIARRLDSPHIVRVLDAGHQDETYFIVQEYAEGETLAQRLRARGRLSVEEAVSIGVQIARALAEAERHHIVHRDISPQNVLIDRDGVAKVADFGIARDLSDTLSIGTSFIGKPHYASPDQWSGSVDIRSDIYSLGVVLFHMLAGAVPFNDATPLGTMRMHQERAPPPLRELRPDVPQALHEIVHRCLAKRPQERYQTAGELVEALLDVGPASRTAAREGGRRAIPRPVLAVALAGGLLVSTLVGVVAFNSSSNGGADAVLVPSVAPTDVTITPFVTSDEGGTDSVSSVAHSDEVKATPESGSIATATPRGPSPTPTPTPRPGPVDLVITGMSRLSDGRVSVSITNRGPGDVAGGVVVGVGDETRSESLTTEPRLIMLAGTSVTLQTVTFKVSAGKDVSALIDPFETLSDPIRNNNTFTSDLTSQTAPAAAPDLAIIVLNNACQPGIPLVVTLRNAGTSAVRGRLVRVTVSTLSGVQGVADNLVNLEPGESVNLGTNQPIQGPRTTARADLIGTPGDANPANNTVECIVQGGGPTAMPPPIYTVLSGDTLAGICARQRPSLNTQDCVNQIRVLNNLWTDGIPPAAGRPCRRHLIVSASRLSVMSVKC